jgi:Transcription factor WhiB
MTDWELAKCRGMLDLFFDERPAQVAYAKHICSDCPIKQACLITSLEYAEPYGVWAGLDYEERRATAVLLGYKPPSRVEDVEHGTERGYNWHQRTGTPIEYDKEGTDICGCHTAQRKKARNRMAEYRKRVRSGEISRRNR